MPIHRCDLFARRNVCSTLLYIAVLCRKPVEELLERLFLSLDIITGAKHLKQLCFDEFVDFKQTNPCLQFNTGDTGGVKVVVTGDNGLVMSLSLFWLSLHGFLSSSSVRR